MGVGSRVVERPVLWLLLLLRLLLLLLLFSRELIAKV